MGFSNSAQAAAQHQEQAVEQAPRQKRPARPVPQAAQPRTHAQVETGLHGPRRLPRERDVQVSNHVESEMPLSQKSVTEVAAYG